MKDQKPSHSMYFSGQLFADLINPPTGRRQRSKSIALAQHYESKDAMAQQNELEGLSLIGNLIKAANNKSEKEFYSSFLFGVPLKIFRKGKIKECVFFIDQNIPSFMWISTKSKAFLFDLTYTTIQRYNFEIERVTNLKHYLILYYFQEELPIVFEGEKAAEQVEKYYEMIQAYIVYNRIVSIYPSYFSQVLKRYIIEQIKEDVTRQKKSSQVLKVACEIGWNNEQHNRNILREILQKKGQSLSADLSKIYLTPQEINNFFKICSCCSNTKDIFEKYSGVTLINSLQYLEPLMKRQSFWEFLVNEQAESAQFISDICQSSKEMLSFYDFSSYLLNQQNNYAAAVESINEHLPLTDYFCYSSHNTYLSGNQLTSDSKIERYLQDLDNGLKCVQIDVHNDGQRPIITHAFNDKSFCKPIDFEETIKVIGEFCRKNKNHYPLILSIENHAMEENRYRMFNILYKVFDKKLFMVNSEVDFQKTLQCKTLAQLKGKIIIKTDSKISEIVAFKSKLEQHKTSFSPSLNPLPVYSEQAPFPNLQFSQRFQKFEETIRRYKQRKNNFQKQIQRQLYLPLAQMTKITGMFKTIAGIDTQDSCGYECTSLTNEKAAKSDQKKVIAYTKRSWLRIYPLGSEIASSNYNPIPHLKNGAQIIALNTQTKDDYAWLLMSYFICGREINPSKIGYIPKPAHLLKNSVESKKNVIKVIQIKNLSTEKIGIKFFGSDRDTKSNSNATNSFNVNDYLEGFLMFEIGAKFKDCIALRFIRQGYRVLVAKNEYFRDSGIRVLVRIQIKETIWS